MWIELVEPVKVNGVRRQPGYRTDYPRSAAVALISSERAVPVQGPHEGRDHSGYEVGEVGFETTDPEQDSAVKLEDDEEGQDDADTKEDAFKETTPDEFLGLSEEDQQAVEERVSEAEENAETSETEEDGDDEDGATLDDLDLQSIDGIGPSTVDKIKDEYEDLEEFREADLTEIDGVSEARAKKLEDLDAET